MVSSTISRKTFQHSFSKQKASARAWTPASVKSKVAGHQQLLRPSCWAQEFNRLAIRSVGVPGLSPATSSWKARQQARPESHAKALARETNRSYESSRPLRRPRILASRSGVISNASGKKTAGLTRKTLESDAI